MLKLIIISLMASSFMMANMSFDELDQMSEPHQNASQVEAELQAFESSLNNKVDADAIEPSAGFEELDSSIESLDQDH